MEWSVFMKARVTPSVAADGALVIGGCSQSLSPITSSAVAPRLSSNSVSPIPRLVGMRGAAASYALNCASVGGYLDAIEAPSSATTWAVPPRTTTREANPRFARAITDHIASANGNAWQGATITRVATINHANFTISGNTAITDASGIATLTARRIEKPGGCSMTVLFGVRRKGIGEVLDQRTVKSIRAVATRGRSAHESRSSNKTGATQ
jgi:hypothetical protein